MKGRFFALLVAIFPMAASTWAQTMLNATNFPDANFRKALAASLSVAEGSLVSAEKIAATKKLDVSGKAIADLKGIEHFTALTELYCHENQLTALDLTQNTALEVVSCYDNSLNSLNLSKNSVLSRLYCYENRLNALDVTKNTELTKFVCYDNQLSTLDVSKNTRCKNYIAATTASPPLMSRKTPH